MVEGTRIANYLKLLNFAEELMKLTSVLALAVILAGSFAGSAAAQLASKPYDFPGGGGPGMSVAARQAIIIHEIDPSFSPDFLIRGPGGGLLSIVPNPGDDDVPLVRAADGTIIPVYHRGYDRDGTPPLGAGIFNPYFASYDGGSYGMFPVAFGADTISIWTARVMNVVGYAPTGDSIDVWTAAAYLIGPAF